MRAPQPVARVSLRHGGRVYIHAMVLVETVPHIHARRMVGAAETFVGVDRQQTVALDRRELPEH